MSTPTYVLLLQQQMRSSRGHGGGYGGGGGDYDKPTSDVMLIVILGILIAAFIVAPFLIRKYVVPGPATEGIVVDKSYTVNTRYGHRVEIYVDEAGEEQLVTNRCYITIRGVNDDGDTVDSEYRVSAGVFGSVKIGDYFVVEDGNYEGYESSVLVSRNEETEDEGPDASSDASEAPTDTEDSDAEPEPAPAPADNDNTGAQGTMVEIDGEKYIIIDGAAYPVQ